jgi:hypothetical protein
VQSFDEEINHDFLHEGSSIKDLLTLFLCIFFFLSGLLLYKTFDLLFMKTLHLSCNLEHVLDEHVFGFVNM